MSTARRDSTSASAWLTGSSPAGSAAARCATPACNLDTTSFELMFEVYYAVYG